MRRFISWLTKRLSRQGKPIGDRVCMWMGTGILIFTLMVAAVIVVLAGIFLLVIAVAVDTLAVTWRAAAASAGMKWTSPNRRR